MDTRKPTTSTPTSQAAASATAGAAVGEPDPAAARARGLPPAWRKFLLTVHLVVAVGLPAGAAALITLGVAGLTDADPLTVYPAMNRIAEIVIVPLALLALLTGIIQGALPPWGLFRHWWVTLKLGFTAVLAAVASFVLTPQSAAAADAALAGAALPQADRFRLVLFPAVAAAVLLANVLLGVYKPFGRLTGRG